MDNFETMNKIIPFLARIFIGSLFIYAGAIKALDPFQFTVDIQNYRLVPLPLAAFAALYLPWLEIICGGSLIRKKLYSGSLAILLILMIIFTVALGIAWMKGLDITCGCFGNNGGRSHYAEWLARDFLIVGMLIFLISKEWLRPSTS